MELYDSSAWGTSLSGPNREVIFGQLLSMALGRVWITALKRTEAVDLKL
jgi:hypothetical protein